MIHKTEVVNVDSQECTIVVTYGESLKTPLTVYINSMNNSTCGDYVYTIQNTSANLINTDNTGSSVTSLSQLLSRKYNRPAYVNINGSVSDVVPLFQAIKGMINL